MKTIFLELYPFIIILGVIGNILSLLVYSRKKFENTIFKILFKTIAIFDLIATIVPLHSYFLFKFNYDINLLSEFSCRFFEYLIYVISPCSTYILVYVSFDRMMNVMNSNLFKFRNSKQFQIRLCWFIFIFNFIFYLPIPYHKELLVMMQNSSKKRTECFLNDDGFIHWVDLFYSTLIPFVLMLIFTTITIVSLFRSRKRTIGIKPKDIKFAITSISIDISFFLLVGPLTLYFLIVNYVRIDYDTFLVYFIFFCSFYSLNYSIRFYIYIFVNSIFRREFKNMILEFFNDYCHFRYYLNQFRLFLDFLVLLFNKHILGEFNLDFI